MALERGLVTPREPGVLRIDTPAGVVEARYVQNGPYIDSVRITNVASFLYQQDLEVEVPGLGTLVVDIAYGGNFYAIVEPQKNYPGLDSVTPADIIAWSPKLRTALMESNHRFIHPLNPAINGLRHVLWTGDPHHPEAHARNAVFYGDKAIDRSPCGTGTSARMAQWAAKGRLRPGDDFVHESIIGTLFRGRVERAVKLGDTDAIIPSIEGWARMTGFNTIFVDDRDPLAHGFSLV